jgi:twitching motility protein PilT
MNAYSKTLGDLLVDNRMLSKENVGLQLQQEEETGIPFSQLVVSEGLVREEDLLRVFAEKVGLEYVHLDEVIFTPDVIVRLEPIVCRNLNAVPIEMVGNKLKVAVADPFNTEILADLERHAGCEVVRAIATRDSIIEALDGLFGVAEADVEDATSQGVMRSEELPTINVNELLLILLERKGSDLHLAAGSKPIIRVDGELIQLHDYDVLKPAELRSMIYALLTEKQREAFEENLELDCSHPLPGHARFRVNVMFQRESVGAVFRAIPEQAQTLEQLGMPESIAALAELARGLVLVTGPTGSGKSTTLAALVDVINETRACHILTIEDPIEFVHHHKKSLVNQREVGQDTRGFSSALKHALRQDPDVLLVGEMRDLETISTALTAAETGHLVFATLHTQDAPQSIDRIVDVFPAGQQAQVRVQLASTIQAIVTQQLIPTAVGAGRTAALEIMMATPGIRNLIREGKGYQITSAMQAGGRHGMQTMDQSLAHLVKQNIITYEAAIERCSNVEDLRRLLGRVA